MSRGDKETEEVASTEGHNGTYPEQSQPALQHFSMLVTSKPNPLFTETTEPEGIIHSSFVHSDYFT